jgi:hypothetical protein
MADLSTDSARRTTVAGIHRLPKSSIQTMEKLSATVGINGHALVRHKDVPERDYDTKMEFEADQQITGSCGYTYDTGLESSQFL